MINRTDELLERIAELLDIPRSYYEKATARHKSLGEWFCREGSLIAQYAPEVYPQGSFRLGTVIRPMRDTEEYDLDIVCQLRNLGKLDITQKHLKQLVGHEVREYASKNNIKEPVVERKRCWRIDYSDEVKFHIDTLPCLMEDGLVIAALVRLGVPLELAKLAIAITCKTRENYEVISTDWPKSNPAGYAAWFEHRMAVQAAARRKQLFAEGLYESVQQVPTYALKTPLQQSIQILKRHRDVMFRDDADGKPISIIITTLATLSYAGEHSIGDTLRGVLDRMLDHVRASEPRVPNPVNPAEDFADKWATAPKLERNFRDWHAQARIDFEALGNVRDAEHLKRRFSSKFGLALADEEARSLTGDALSSYRAAPAVHVKDAPKPWARNV